MRKKELTDPENAPETIGSCQFTRVRPAKAMHRFEFHRDDGSERRGDGKRQRSGVEHLQDVHNRRIISVDVGESRSTLRILGFVVQFRKFFNFGITRK